MLTSIHANFINANSYFMVWQSLEKLINPDEIWIDKAQENLDSMNKYKNFFIPIMWSCKNMYLLELAKCFDNDKKVLSIFTVLSFGRENINELTFNNYKLYKKDEVILEEDEYEAISMDFLDSCNKKIKSKSKIINRLMNFRNQYLGHNQLYTDTNSSITIDEVIELMKLLMELWNDISHRLLRATWWHNFSDKQAYEEMERLLNYLHRFEKYRLREIQMESKKRLSEYRKNVQD